VGPILVAHFMLWALLFCGSFCCGPFYVVGHFLVGPFVVGPFRVGPFLWVLWRATVDNALRLELLGVVSQRLKN